MATIINFLISALPWIAIGLFVACSCVNVKAKNDGKENGFKEEMVKRFAGPETFPFYMRVMLSIMFKTVAKKRYAEVANEWGSKRPIDYRPWV